MSEPIKVKLILIRDVYTGNGYDPFTDSVIQSGITDWEEISQTDYSFLIQNRWRLREAASAILKERGEELDDFDVAILCHHDFVTAKTTIAKIKDSLAKQLEAERKRLEKEAAAREATRAKRAADKAAKEKQKLLDKAAEILKDENLLKTLKDSLNEP